MNQHLAIVAVAQNAESSFRLSTPADVLYRDVQRSFGHRHRSHDYSSSSYRSSSYNQARSYAHPLGRSCVGQEENIAAIDLIKLMDKRQEQPLLQELVKRIIPVSLKVDVVYEEQECLNAVVTSLQKQLNEETRNRKFVF
ncbi:hypothetical protein Aduo_012697 [Ancylostoma duodenale]